MGRENVVELWLNFSIKDSTGTCCPFYEITDRSEMSWSTYVNTVIFWYRKILSGQCILIFNNNIHRLKTPVCFDIFSCGTYIFYNKINLYCCFCGDGWWGLYVPVIPFSECSNRLRLSQQRTACWLNSVRNSTCDWSSSNTQKALPEKNISLKRKKTNKILIFSIFIPVVKVIYNKVYVAIIIFKNHKQFLYCILAFWHKISSWIFTQEKILFKQ